MGLGKPTDLEQNNKPQLRILVVDDDDLNRRMMKVLLGREGYNVDLAANGLEALDAVKYQRYDLVFMDLQMPVMDGVESSRRIRDWEKDASHTFIVALTASYLPEEGHILYAAGIDNYISKPFEIEHIQRMLRYIHDTRTEASASPAVQMPPIAEIASSHELLDVRLGLRRVGGDEAVYKELLNDFLSELPSKLNDFERHFLERDMPTLGRLAHNLKGVAANLGAMRLSECAGKLDKQCNEGYTESIEGLILEVKETGSRLQDVVRNFLTGATVVEGLSQV
jgi:CheY-like chemotaxis protein/HPt (histidine-containing phosphotransfer) domain-containing protein